jgi:hypothetical protein
VLVTAFWRMPPWGLSGTSLLLGVLMGANALLGLLALSRPRQALPEPGPNALPLLTAGHDPGSS